MTTLPASSSADAARTHTPLAGAECQRLGQHIIVWDGQALCCDDSVAVNRLTQPRNAEVTSPK